MDSTTSQQAKDLTLHIDSASRTGYADGTIDEARAFAHMQLDEMRSGLAAELSRAVPYGWNPDGTKIDEREFFLRDAERNHAFLGDDAHPDRVADVYDRLILVEGSIERHYRDMESSDSTSRIRAARHAATHESAIGVRDALRRELNASRLPHQMDIQDFRKGRRNCESLIQERTGETQRAEEIVGVIDALYERLPSDARRERVAIEFDGQKATGALLAIESAFDQALARTQQYGQSIGLT